MRSCLSVILLRCATIGAFTRIPHNTLAFASNSCVDAYRVSPKLSRRFGAAKKTMSSSDHPLQTDLPSNDVEMKAEFESISPNIDEKAIRRESPEELVLALAHAKASALLHDGRIEGGHGTTLLLTCDQVVVHNSKILEKPESREEAAQFIRGYGVSPCSTVGATVVTNVQTGQRYEAVDIAKIFFRPIPEAVIQALVEEGDVMYCAGGLRVEEERVQPYLERIEGGMNAVMGLSKRTVRRLMLAALGRTECQ